MPDYRIPPGVTIPLTNETIGNGWGKPVDLSEQLAAMNEDFERRMAEQNETPETAGAENGEETS